MTNINEIYEDAISHCRWKSSLMTLLTSIDMESYKNISFEAIFETIATMCCAVKGIGLLTVYDIVSAICFNHGVSIDKVYIIGGGPKRAVQLLNIKTKTQRIGIFRLKYVSIHDVIDAFTVSDYVMDPDMKAEVNGDSFETYICNWQKTITTGRSKN
jgi:hypothetical protein